MFWNGVPEGRQHGMVAVTGASGFIGRHLVRALASQGIAVNAMARDLSRIPELPLVARLACDITDAESLRPGFKGAVTVIHAAALVGGITAGELALRAANVEGTRNAMLVARDAGSVTRFIHVSTVGVMGCMNRSRPVDEEDVPTPRSLYGSTKLEAERVVTEVAAHFERVVVRPMWVYGLDSPSTSKLIRNIRSRRMVLIGPSDNLIQPVYVDDLTCALMQCVLLPRLAEQVIQLAGPSAFPVEEMCREVARQTGSPAPRIRLPLWAARAVATILERTSAGSGRKLPLDNDKIDFFRVHHAYSLERATRVLGWKPQVSFPEGIARTLAYLS